MKRTGFLVIALVIALRASGGQDAYVVSHTAKGVFPLVAGGIAAPLFVDSHDFPGVLRVAKMLQNDIAMVTGMTVRRMTDSLPAGSGVVIIGTLGRNAAIDRLIREGKLSDPALRGKRETFLIQSVENPAHGVSRALVIAGSDKRGTIYGMLDLSAQIGVSPWHWWADVPPPKRDALYVLPGAHSQGEPAVRYRGIFINDEAPALSGWAYEKFGGFNATFYDHVFQLILRLKGNFLWPAMWGRAFSVDDPENPVLANEYGIVIGTSHHEPMMRAHAEWAMFGSGPWNYEKNDSTLREFWREGVRRMDGNESLITVGMRGDGDEPMSEESNIALLQRIVRDQRTIIHEVTGRNPADVHQVWALYKEVQDYYDKGMRVDDDITLLLCDDNWGNIRKIPQRNERPRDGGYGVYYHFDYVGGPRNYKWLNTNQIERVWEQMHLAYEYSARRLWIVNVGDIKPMEFPTQFFLDYAWNPDAWPAARVQEYYDLWARQQFGPAYAGEIAEILRQYTRFNSRRKPELLSPDTYSVTNFHEADSVVAQYNDLRARARRIAGLLPREMQDAFYQLVLHPVEACANLNELYVTVGRNQLYARQGRSATNDLAEHARVLFARDSAITAYYNHRLADGKWNHMMDQTHIGYTYWQQPDSNAMPAVSVIDVPATSEMGVSIEGSTEWWPASSSPALLPLCDAHTRQPRSIDIFNRGMAPFTYSVTSTVPWVRVDAPHGTIDKERRVNLVIDLPAVPDGTHRVPLTVSGPSGTSVTVEAIVRKTAGKSAVRCFYEGDGFVSMEAGHYSRAVSVTPVTWTRIAGLGRTSSAMTPFPVTAPPQDTSAPGSRLEYDVWFATTGPVTVKAYLSPTLNFHNSQGLRYGVSFDDETPQIVNIHAGRSFRDWEESVSNNITIASSVHEISSPGVHVLKFRAVDPGVVLQKLVVWTGPERTSYLGPPESAHVPPLTREASR